MSLDILILAAIAVAILAKLWSVLGRRSDEDRTQPNPFDAPPALTPLAQPPAATMADVPVLPPIVTLPPTSVEGGLAQLRAIDPAFDERAFLRQVKSDFALIVTGFASGDLTHCEALLSPVVRTQFEKAIAARKAAGQVVETVIVDMRDADTTAVRVDGTKATLTVSITSRQKNTLRDASGQIVGGDEKQVEEITDLWVFGRDTAVKESGWQLVETKS